MKTIHLVLNAHIDPVWLWPWQAGLDAALATCRSACDRLDAHRDVVFTRGEAWIYDQIERTDAKLFRRIEKHIKAGRWEIVGGWWIQPDCNLPSGFAFRRQIEIGKRYFLDRFGTFPRVAYNVDSFGHAATLPTMMRAAGQDRYVMMRPQEHEMSLPSRLFRWREKAGSPEVVTFRIAGSYTSPAELHAKHVEKSLTELPEGIDHTMCFIGIGDHGGGPTERMIQWCRKNREVIPGWRLEFSSPARFFEAIEGRIGKLPVVTGELQYHAIGCYSVYRPIKVSLRKSEHLLEQAEAVRAIDPAPESGTGEKMEEAWRQVCLHHFHDILGGSCIASAVPQVEAQLGMSRAVADDVIQHGLRRRVGELPDDAMQRVVLFNASDAVFEDYLEIEPWLAWKQWEQHWRLLDEKGRAVPVQLMESEAVVRNLTRLLLHVKAKAGEMRVLRIDRGGVKEDAIHATGKSSIGASMNSIGSGDFSVYLGARQSMKVDGKELAVPRLDLIEDLSDTWSHKIDRYGGEPVAEAKWDEPVVADRGPLMASVIQRGRIGRSTVVAEYRVYKGKAFVEMMLRVHWMELHKILKLTIALAGSGTHRMDGILGGELKRAMDGREVPLRDRTVVSLSNGKQFGVVCPDVFAMDGTGRRLRMTLLRSPLIAHHDPQPAESFRAAASDQGVHEFRFRFFHGARVSGAEMDRQALGMQRPPIMADLTRGMPAV